MEDDGSLECKEQINSYFKKSAEQGCACGAQSYAEHVWEGAEMKESERQFQIAVEYAQKAVKKDDAKTRAHFILGQTHQTGK
jgi:TPR repeat protein